MCSQGYLLTNSSTCCCQKFTLEPFNLISGGWAMQALGKWSARIYSRKKTCYWMWTSILHNFVLTAFMFENAIWRVPFTILIFYLQEVVNQCQNQNITALSCVKLTSPCKKQMMQWMSVRLTSFIERFCGFYRFGSIHA